MRDTGGPAEPDGLLTIGAFARRAELTPKALRLYDELGLLRPVRVDPASGYRYYAPEQLERARLVAWLRLLGMPLARITGVCALPTAAAAAEVAAYWAQVEHDTESRRRLAHFLAQHFKAQDFEAQRIEAQHFEAQRLDGRDPAKMTATTLTLRHAAACDSGLVRETNQDTAYAGPGLLAVADGFGRAGERASALVVDALKALPGPPGGAPGETPADAVPTAVAEANRRIAALDDANTTLTAMLWSGAEFTLAHVGDSRAYLLRDGELRRLTTDHSHVRTLIDEGRLTEDEAAAHPQRALLTRALDGREGSGVDVSPHRARAGDRYLLCTDGLSAVVPDTELRAALRSGADPETAVRDLVVLARRAGGPDNIAVVVADVA